MDHDTNLYRIEPVSGEVNTETYPHWGGAAKALLERHQRIWGERRDQLRREIAECEDILP